MIGSHVKTIAICSSASFYRKVLDIERALIEKGFQVEIPSTAKIVASDAILVVNEEKRGIPGYIGGNVLMEMALAFHFGKPIYVLNPVLESSPFQEEILGMGSIMLNGNLDAL